MGSGSSQATGSLNNLSDVDTTVVNSGQVLGYQGSVLGWVPVNQSGGSSTLSGLNDVSVSAPVISRTLIYNGTNWVQGIGSGAITQLSGVNVSSPATNRALVYNGTTWVPGYASGSLNLMSGVIVSSPQSQETLFHDGTRFVNRFINFNIDLSGVSIISPTQGQSLRFNSGLGAWQEDSGVNLLERSYFSGVIDITRVSGITTTGDNITDKLQAIVNNLQPQSVLRIPPGIYYLDKTIHWNAKHSINIDARGAKFIEVSSRLWLNSGTFYLNKCTGINWYGGSLSGAARLDYILSVASGVKLSGGSMNDLALDTQLDRNVVPCTFNMEQCTNTKIDGFDTVAKYRHTYMHRCFNTAFMNIFHASVHTGYLNRGDQTVVSGAVLLGHIQKEACRPCYAWHYVKGEELTITNCHTRNCGGFLVCGSLNLGGGQGYFLPTMIVVGDSTAKDSYDNHIYLSSVDKAQVNNFMGINNTGLPHSIGGIKSRGSYISYNGCYIEHAHDAYGFEGASALYNDLWKIGAQGWSAHGCQLVNSRAVDINAFGCYTDRNDDNDSFPRDVLIANNYFYNCGLGPYGSSPTGYNTENIDNSVIRAADAYRVTIINNVIENSGVYGPDQAIFVGRLYTSAGSIISGVTISNNKFLGSKAGIHLRDVALARIKDNYGERIGTYGAPFTMFTGIPALIRCEGVTNSIIKDNIIVPTGGYVVSVIPETTFEGNVMQDNFGTYDM